MSGPLLPSFADHLDVTVLLHDIETGSILDANDAAEELYGYTVAELREQGIAGVSTESPRFSHERALDRIQTAADGETPEFQWQIRHASNEVRWVQVSLQRIALDGDPYVLAEIQDVTQYKKRARRLTLLHRIIRHNLRNEMSVVMGHAEHLEEALADEDYERQAKIIQDVATDVGGLTRSVKQIEEIATNDASDFEPTNVAAVLESVQSEFGAEYSDAAIAVDVSQPVWISADEGLHYGLTHAVENAIEHNDSARPSVVLEATADLVTNRAIVRVVDDGPPIPEMELDAIDATEDTSDISHGSGVGMFVMKWCSESLGGNLDISHREGGGNVVTFTFPLLADPQMAAD
jgi:PAS domain S-box-containing protein